jgi:hypothetical protein
MVEIEVLVSDETGTTRQVSVGTYHASARGVDGRRLDD